MISRKFLRQMPLHLMIWPGVLLVFVYQYIPMYGIVIAFQKFSPSRGFFGSEWRGLYNFKFVMNYPDIAQVLWNTFYISVMKIAAGLVVPIIIALLLNEIGRIAFKRTVQTLVYLPHFLSWVILGGILLDMLSPSEGIINGVLKAIGLEPVFFLGDNKWFPFVLVISEIWKEFGFGTIIYLAALTTINPSLYEAATIDGASRWRQTLYITLPGILPVVILLATLSLGNVLNAGFDQVLNLYSPPVYESGDIVDTLVYRIGLVQAQYSIATAIGLFKSVVSFFLISFSYWAAYRFANYRIF